MGNELRIHGGTDQRGSGDSRREMGSCSMIGWAGVILFIAALAFILEVLDEYGDL